MYCVLVLAREHNRGKRCASRRNWKFVGLTQDLESSRSLCLSSRKTKSAGCPRLAEYRSTRRAKSRTDCDSRYWGRLMVVTTTCGDIS